MNKFLLEHIQTYKDDIIIPICPQVLLDNLWKRLQSKRRGDIMSLNTTGKEVRPYGKEEVLPGGDRAHSTRE